MTLLPGVTHQEVSHLLAAADICLVPLRDVPLFATFIPSKMFEYLAAGKAVIGSVTGEAAQILREAGAWSCRRRTAWRWPTRSATLAISPQRRQAMGRPGAAYVEQCYDRAALAREYRKILDTVGGGDEAAGHRGQRFPRRVRPGRGQAARARGVALARSDTGCRQPWPATAPKPLTGDFDDRRRAHCVFPRAARCAALVNIASLGFGHAPAIVDRDRAGGHRPRAVFVSTTAVTTTLAGAVQGGSGSTPSSRSGSPG